MRIISTLFILFVPFLCLSQATFKSGIIVNNNGDTLKGYIKEDIEKNLQNKIIFKQNDSDDETKLLTTKEIKAFGFEGKNIFQKISYTNPNDNSWNEHFAKLCSMVITGYFPL